MISDADLGRLALSFMAGFGQAKVRRAFEQPLDHSLSAIEALELLAPGANTHELLMALNSARKLVEGCELASVQLLPMSTDAYPSPLLQIPDPPPFIYVRGNLPATWEKAVAVIGTRHPDPDAISAAREAVRGLAVDPDAIVVSGLALGIDSVAHEEALRSGLKTVAVLAHGLQMVYPKSNEGLANRILDAGGCWISEIRLGEELSKFSLVARDRLQSGLSIATTLVQSSLTGGSMHTALFTLEQKRKLLALEPLSNSSEWLGNEYLVSRTREFRDLKKAEKYSRFPRPNAIKIGRSTVAQFMAAGLRTSFVPKASTSELTPTLALPNSVEQPLFKTATERPTQLKSNDASDELFAGPEVVESAVEISQATAATGHPPNRQFPFGSLLRAIALASAGSIEDRYTISIRLDVLKNRQQLSEQGDTSVEEGDSDSTWAGGNLTRRTIFFLGDQLLEVTGEFKLNRFNRPAALHIVLDTILALRLAVGAAKVAFDALSSEHIIETGLPLRPSSVDIKSSDGKRFSSGPLLARGTRAHQRPLPPVFASLNSLFAMATMSGSDELATIGYYRLLEALLGPINSGLLKLGKDLQISVADMRRAKLHPDVAEFDSGLRGKQYSALLKHFKSLRNIITHGSFDAIIGAQSLEARSILMVACEDLIDNVWSSFVKVGAKGVNDEQFLQILRSAGSQSPERTGTPTPATDEFLAPLLSVTRTTT
jgi:DNA processing protein